MTAFSAYVLVIVAWPILAWLASDELIEKLLRTARIGRQKDEP